MSGSEHRGTAAGEEPLRAVQVRRAVLDDLVAGARRVIVAMEHTTRDGGHKILPRCTLPFTGVHVVDLIVTEKAVIDVVPEGLVLREIAADTTLEAVRAATGAPLRVAASLPTFE